ncbi:unnamed protein product [Miscanthus lutarioriparius]|uniref:Zinc finger GRF-type domain-containing protein n=1 Tax=Miscanthus lutarioriparius TaxID=422564 RepID=A0A811PPS0_9POAL|nr:unnamed protein product [Miscanthus lutarioriparius]
MSHFIESSRGGRARSRLQGARGNCIGSEHGVVLDPVGELSGFPLIPCVDCSLARVVEGRTKKDGDNHGRLYFKCARNGEYFQQLKDRGIIIVHPSNWAELLDEEGSMDSPNIDTKKKILEQKLEILKWKMNMFIVCVVCVVLGCVLMYAVIK